MFCRVEIPSSPNFLAKLGKILTPYPGVVFTPSSGCRTPVFKDDGSVWDYDDLSLHRAETLSAIRVDESLHSKLKAFTSLTESQPNISVTALDRGNTLGENGWGHSDDNYESDDDPEDAEDTENQNLTPLGISFSFQTEIFKGAHLSSSSRPFQTFKINGIFDVQVSPCSCILVKHELTTKKDDSWTIITEASSIQISYRIQKARVSI